MQVHKVDSAVGMRDKALHYGSVELVRQLITYVYEELLYVLFLDEPLRLFVVVPEK